MPSLYKNYFIWGVLTCQSGSILENIEKYVATKGLTVPLDLGSRSSCQIGGNVSTNAGGMRLFRYGNLHGNILGLEAVSITMKLMHFSMYFEIWSE